MNLSPLGLAHQYSLLLVFVNLPLVGLTSTWTHPYTFQVKKDETGITISKRRTNGQDGYAPEKLTLNETVIVAPENWK